MDCKAYLYESLINPGALVVAGFENIMTDMRRQISEDQIWAVVAYLQSQGGEVTVTAEDLPKASAAGGVTPTESAVTATTDPRALLTEKGCLGCHILEGKGAPIGPPLDGIGRRRTAEYLRRSILLPNADTAKGYERFAGTMPPTFGQMLSAAQLEALVQFLASRQ
jgi:mono/diheme cytochrome c family protein